jgi:uncharacterized protein GlcG (DUF336 family)
LPKPSWALTEDDVALLLGSVVDAARGAGLGVVVAVAEASGYLIGLTRMDGSRLPATRVAVAKAWTAAIFQRPSGEYHDRTAPGGPAFGLPNVFPGEMLPMAGGLPLFVDDVCVGGIGVSGGTTDEDVQLASAALAAFQERAK